MNCPNAPGAGVADSRFLRAALLTMALVACAVAMTGSALGSGPPGQGYIVVLKGSVDHPGAVAAEHGRRYGVETTQTYRHALNGYAGRIPGRRLAALENDPEVRFVTEDRTVEAAALPVGVDRIDADLSSTSAGDGSGSVDANVAVVDGGIDLQHPDLNVVGGVNCSNEKKGGYDDYNGHGTHVAGTIAAKDDGIDDPSGLEVTGVAPGANLWAVRVLRKFGIGTFSELICGIDFVTATRTDSDPDNDIAVANMSIGGKGKDDRNCGLTNKDAFHLAFCRSTAAGVTWVVSAMNSTEDFGGIVPASYDEVLTATAIADYDGQPGGLAAPTDGCASPDDQPGGYSNFAVDPDDQVHTLAAPGTCIRSTWLVDGGSPPGYAVLSGTSMAAPHITGTAALCIAAGECTGTPQQIIQTLIADATAYNLANPGYGFTGDPLRPLAGRYYGYLVDAGGY